MKKQKGYMPEPYTKYPVTRAWAIQTQHGHILTNTIAYTRTNAIKKATEGWNPDTSWRWAKRKYGLRAIRVEITAQ